MSIHNFPKDDIAQVQEAYETILKSWPLRSPSDPTLKLAWEKAYSLMSEARSQLEAPFTDAIERLAKIRNATPPLATFLAHEIMVEQEKLSMFNANNKPTDASQRRLEELAVRLATEVLA